MNLPKTFDVMLPFMSAEKGDWRVYLDEPATDAEVLKSLGRSWDEAANLMKKGR